MKIEIKNLVHAYSDTDIALKAINLTVDSIEPLAIIGQNGSGKTTLVKHFNGILRPTSGEVLINGENINSKSVAKWSKYVGYVFQNPDDQIFLDTIKKELEFGPRQIGMSESEISERIEYVSDLCNLKDKLDVHPFDLMLTEKKFCTIASIIMMNPDVVVFDEPTCGQDIDGTNRLRKIIEELYKEGKLCVTISHDMKFVVNNFKRAVVLCNGDVLMDGSTEEVFSQPEELVKSFIQPPPITRVAQKVGLGDSVFTIDDFMNKVLNYNN